MADGWHRQGIQIPEAMGEWFRGEASLRGLGSVRQLGTLAVALLEGLDPQVRHELYLWAFEQSWRGPEALTTRAIMAELEAIEQRLSKRG